MATKILRHTTGEFTVYPEYYNHGAPIRCADEEAAREAFNLDKFYREAGRPKL